MNEEWQGLETQIPDIYKDAQLGIYFVHYCQRTTASGALADLFSENAILFNEIFDRLLLTLIHPASNRNN